MIEAFIRKNGVTECPPCGSKELAEFNAQRERNSAMTGGFGWRAVHASKKRRMK